MNIRTAIKAAFYEGYESYQTPCNAFNTADEAWDESSFKNASNVSAESIREAFEEGFDSVATSCNAYNTVEDAWENSLAKDAYEQLKGVAA